MIQLRINVVEGKVGRIRTYGFSLSCSRILYMREALDRLRDASPTWMVLVPKLIAYLLENHSDEAWRIKVWVDQIETRSFESTLTPVTLEISRRSRYKRDPVI
jgi:hypothetical protein